MKGPAWPRILFGLPCAPLLPFCFSQFLWIAPTALKVSMLTADCWAVRQPHPHCLKACPM
jgi:hypothetical protein